MYRVELKGVREPRVDVYTGRVPTLVRAGTKVVTLIDGREVYVDEMQIARKGKKHFAGMVYKLGFLKCRKHSNTKI